VVQCAVDCILISTKDCRVQMKTVTLNGSSKATAAGLGQGDSGENPPDEKGVHLNRNRIAELIRRTYIRHQVTFSSFPGIKDQTQSYGRAMGVKGGGKIL